MENFPFPKIFLYKYLDRAARGVRKEIVDGQQRINTIRRYYTNDFALRGDSSNAGKRFADLAVEVQDHFLSYSVPVDVIRNATRAEILQMFRRMNAFTMPLNEAEKRHSSFQGSFKWFVNGLSDALNEFFVEYGVFSERQIVRMTDAALISDCFLAMEKGVISSSPKELTSLYRKYDSESADLNDYRHKLSEAFSFISANFSDLRKSFMMKPYALHSLITALIHARYGIQQISVDWKCEPTGRFAADPVASARALLAMAQAHEAGEVEGPHQNYVWGCLSTTDRKARRTARVGAILRVLGVEVAGAVDANLT